MRGPVVPLTNDIEGLAARIAARATPVAVIGQGYVGLTLAAAAADAGFRVTGIDVDTARSQALSRGDLVVPGVDETLFHAGRQSGNLTFATSTGAMADALLIFVCVPTPLRDDAPDMSFVEAAAREVAAHLVAGAMVVLESTTYPGTTEQLMAPLLEEGSGLRAGTDFLLAYAPERIDPGNTKFGMRNTPRVVGGTTAQATEAAVAFYSQLVDKVIAVSSARAAETAKLLENSFRHLNIALVNELATLTHELGIDVWEVIDAASTKPFGFMPFHPGPGVGGHCIPLDPTYLSWQVRRETGRRFSLIEQALDVNKSMPSYVAERVAEILNGQGRPMKGARILVLGVAYKPDISDVRESPALHIMHALDKRDADVRFHDFFLEHVPLSSGTRRCVRDLDEEVGTADLVVLVTPHTAYDLESIAEGARAVFDTRNAYGAERRDNIFPL